MDSSMKDALTEFINNNTSAIEQVMENGSHDLAKDEPVIPDLVNYLSCPTPTACSKDIEPMSTNEKVDSHNLSFNPLDLQVTQQAHFSSCQLPDTPNTSQFNTGQMCVPSSESSYSSDTPSNQVPPLSHPDIQQQHCLSHHDSYEQSSSLFPDSSLHTSSAACGFQDAQLANPPTFAASASVSCEVQSSQNATDSESQYCHNGQSVQYQVSSDTNEHYHQNQQLMGTENCAGQFHNQSETRTSSFQDSSVLTSSFTSSISSEVSFGCGQDSLGFGLLDVNQTSLGNVKTVTSQLRSPEKMHVDEPENIYQQTNSSASVDHYQAASVNMTSSSDVHMQSYSLKDFHTSSVLDTTQQASAVTNSGLSDSSFSQTLTNVSASNSANEFTASGTLPRNAAQNPATFDISRDAYQPSSVSSPFNNQNFQQSPAVLQACTDLNLQEQPNLCQTKDIITNPAHYQDSSGCSESSFSNPSMQNFSSSQPSPYQGGQYHDSPGHASANIPDSFQKSVVSADSSTPSPGYSQTHHIHHNSSVDSTHYQQSSPSLQPLQLDLNQFQQDPNVNFTADATLTQCTDQQSASFQSNLGSALSGSVLFPSSAADGSQHQQKDYSLNPPSTQVNDTSAFIGYSSSENPLLSADLCTSVNQASVSQSLTDYEMTTSSSPRHALTDSSKTSSDVTMQDFSSGGNLQSCSQTGFSDDTFSQLDLEAMVNSLNAESSASTVPQNESIMSSVIYHPGYSGYEYNDMTSSAVGFPETSHTVADTSTHFSFNEQSQSGQGLDSSTPTLSSTTFDSGICQQSTGNKFESSSFGLTSTSKVSNENYHQPMQVQDSEPHVPFSYHGSNGNGIVAHNTEMAMDLSSNLGEKGGGIASGISFEEIHMSIVKAGNELSKQVSDTKSGDPHRVYDSSQGSHLEGVDSLGGAPGMYSTSPSGMFQAENSDTSSAVTYNAASQSPVMKTSSATSEMMQLHSGFNNDVSACSSDSSISISNSSVDCNIFSGFHNNLQVSSALSNQLLHQDQLSQQAPVTIPNFLENPGAVVSHNHTSNPENLILTTITTHDQPQTSFIIAETPAAKDKPKTLFTSSGMNQPKMVEMQKTGISPRQQSILHSSLPQATGLSGNAQIFESAMNSLQSSSSSFFGQPGTGGINQTSGAAKAPGLSVGPVSSSPGVVLHIVTSQADKTSAVPPTSVSSIKLGTNSVMTHKSGSNITLSGLTPAAASATNPSAALAGSSTRQPHIIVSLEELQKLLAQQNLSHPSPSVPQQQPYTTLSSPQTLVLQKHASHSLKQSQPRLLIKGATLPSQPRLMLPHQQLQQTREKLQLSMHQTHPSEYISTGIMSQRNLEPMAFSATQENQQKVSNNPFQFVSINQIEQQPQQKLHLIQQTVEQQPKVQLQLKQSQLHQHQQQTVNLFLQQVPKAGEQKLAPLQLLGQQQLVLQQGLQKSHTDHKTFAHVEPQLQLPQNVKQRVHGASQKAQNVIQLAQMQQELLLLLKQEEKSQEFEEQQLQKFHLQHHHHLQPLEKPDKADRPCSDSLKKDYKHLHSLLTGESSGGCGSLASTQTKALPSVLNLPTNLQGQSSLQLTNGGTLGSAVNVTPAQTLSSVTQMSTAPFSFIPLNNSSSLQLTNSGSAQNSSPATTLAFVKNLTASIASKAFDIKDLRTTETNIASSRPSSLNIQYSVKPENGSSENSELDILGDHSSRLTSLTHISTERKRSHTPLSVDLNSPANSSSEPASPLLSPTACEDGNTQLTLIERSADLQIKSDSMHGVDDGDDDENANFDVNAFHKRPSADEFHTTREKNESVPMKIAKPSINADARSGANPSSSPEPTFDFGSAITSASNFSFVFGNKEENSSDVFTFGLSGTATTTTDTLLHKEGSKHYRLSSSKPVMKTIGMRATVPTQPVRPTRKQKEHSLKAYYPSKLDNMELKILEQPEPQHRARYQTEGSRGAIKDASQQGFPIIKLFGYNKPAKLQVFIGDECGRVKPHGFYQACRVFGKNSTTCSELEIEDTTVIEIEMLPENDMTVKLDCVGILKLRNADVERRIGPKRAREKKKTNTRARLVMRCLVEKSDGNQQILQVVSNPITCTQPVGQPEISRMSLSESSVQGGDSLFIIGKNFKNKGTSVLFQKLDANDENVVWQVEAEIEQEFFQPTHLICKIPPYKDQAVEQPQLAQIVISCAGKRSDPQSFTYKPVYPVAPAMKEEIPMDTDSASTRSLSFVSPEALHLNRMVQLTNAHSAPTTTIMFQLPQGTIPARQTATVESSSTTASSKLVDHGSTQDHVVVMSSTTTASALSAAVISAPSSASTLESSSSDQALPSFLLEEKHDGVVHESYSRKSSVASAVPVSISGGAKVNCIVHSNSDTSTISPMAYAISDNHQQPSLTSSANAGHVIHSNTHSSMNKSLSSLPSKPFFLVVDQSGLQSHVAGDKIQQLLQHILEAQSQV